MDSLLLSNINTNDEPQDTKMSDLGQQEEESTTLAPVMTNELRMKNMGAKLRAGDQEKIIKARSKGFFKNSASFLKFWKKNVEFTVNGTRFKGRAGNQIKGGPVPLARDLMLDMTPVTLMAGNDETPTAYVDNISEYPQLVYYSEANGELSRHIVPIKKQEAFLQQDKVEMEGDGTDSLEIPLSATLSMDVQGIKVNERGISFETGTLSYSIKKGEILRPISKAAITDNGVELTMGDNGRDYLFDGNTLQKLDTQNKLSEGYGEPLEGENIIDIAWLFKEDDESLKGQGETTEGQTASPANGNMTSSEKSEREDTGSTRGSQEEEEGSALSWLFGEEAPQGDSTGTNTVASGPEGAVTSQQNKPAGQSEKEEGSPPAGGGGLSVGGGVYEIKPTLEGVSLDGNKLAAQLVECEAAFEAFHQRVKAVSGQFSKEEWEAFQKEHSKEALFLSMFPSAVDSLPDDLKLKRSLVLYAIKNAPLIISVIPDVIKLIAGVVKIAVPLIVDTIKFAVNNWDETKQLIGAINPIVSDDYSTWKYIAAFISGERESVQGDKLGYAQEALLQFITTGTVPEVTEDRLKKWGIEEKEEEDNSVFKDYSCRIVIVPGLNAIIGVEPHYSFAWIPTYSIFKSTETPTFEELVHKGVSAFYEAGGEAPKEGKDKTETGGADGNQKKALAAAKKRVLGSIIMNSEASVALSGDIGAKVHAGLEVGAGMLFSVSGEVYGDLSLLGGLGDKKFLIAKAEKALDFADFPKNILSGGDTDLNFQGQINLDASVGSDGKIGSELFGVKKELWDVVLGYWTLLSLGAEFDIKWPANGRFRDIQFSNSFNAKTIHRTIKNRKDGEYGFEFKEKDKEFIELLKNANAEKESMEALDKRFEKLQNLSDEEILALDDNELKDIHDSYLSHSLVQMGYTGKMDRFYKAERNDANFIAERKRLEGKVVKHSQNLKAVVDHVREMEHKNPGFKENGADIMDYYTKTLKTGDGYKKNLKNNSKNSAQEKYGTKDKIIAYEKERLEELTKKHRNNLSELVEFAVKNNITDLDKPSEKFARFYLYKKEDQLDDFDIPGRKGLLNRLSSYVSVGTMLEFEQSRIDMLTKAADERINEISSYREEGADDKEKNSNFIEYYFKNIDGAEGIFKEGLKYGIFSIQDIIDYEESTLMDLERTQRDFLILKSIEEKEKGILAKKESGAPSGNETGSLLAEDEQELKEMARELMKTVGGYEDKDIQKKAYFMATPGELLSYEKYRINKYVSKAAKAEKGQDEFDIMRKLERKTGAYQYVISNKKRMEILKKYVEPETILKYETDRLDSKKKNFFRNYESEAKHEGRINWFRSRLSEIDKMMDPVKQKEEKGKLRDAYFKGVADIESNVSYTDDISKIDERSVEGFLVSYAKKNVKLGDGKGASSYWDNSTREGIKKEIANIVCKKHVQRVDMIEKSIKEKASMEKIWRDYEAMGGGKGFKEWFSKTTTEEKRDKKNEEPQKRQLVIDAMSVEDIKAFLTEKIRRDSRAAYLKRLGRRALNSVKKKAIFFSTQEESELNEINRGGRMTRIEKLKELKKSFGERGNSPLNEKEGQQVIDLYYNTLHAGVGFAGFIKGQRPNLLSRENILKYENGRKKASEKHYGERVKYLKGRNANERTGKEYRDIIIADGDSTWKKLKFSLYSKANTGFEQMIQSELAEGDLQILNQLRPNDIFAYEKDRMEEIGKKHQDRITAMKKPDVTDENALKMYKEAGGGGRFLSKGKENWKGEFEQKKKAYSYESIVKYEEESKAKYEKLLKEHNDRLGKMQRGKEEMQGLRNTGNDRISAIKALIAKKKLLKEGSA